MIYLNKWSSNVRHNSDSAQARLTFGRAANLILRAIDFVCQVKIVFSLGGTDSREGWFSTFLSCYAETKIVRDMAIIL
jgi:hypothetical protein